MMHEWFAADRARVMASYMTGPQTLTVVGAGSLYAHERVQERVCNFFCLCHTFAFIGQIVLFLEGRFMKLIIAAFMAVLLFCTGCGSRRTSTIADSGTPTAGEAEISGEIRGKVLQVLDGGRYVYAEIKTDSETRWVAGPKIELKPGTEVVTAGGAAMRNFKSSILGRTFETVYFVASILPADGAVASSPAAPHGDMMRIHGGQPRAARKPANHPDVERREDPMPVNAWSGDAVEVLHASRYTYVFLKMKDRTIWVAGPRAEMAAGARVLAAPGMPMRDFHSKTLKRDFKLVYFTRLIKAADSHLSTEQKPVASPPAASTAGE